MLPGSPHQLLWGSPLGTLSSPRLSYIRRQQLPLLQRDPYLEGEFTGFHAEA